MRDLQIRSRLTFAFLATDLGLIVPPAMTQSLRPALEAAIDEFSRASSFVEQVRLQAWDAEGLTVTQLRLLSAVGEDEGISNAELAGKLNASRASVSALLDRLERAGFVRRDISRADRRSIRIWLGEAGRNAVANLTKELRELTLRLMDGLDDQELIVIQAALSNMVEVGREARRPELRKAP